MSILDYLGLGLFLTDFLPYFLHLYPSSRISTSDLVRNAIRSVRGRSGTASAALLKCPIEGEPGRFQNPDQ